MAAEPSPGKEQALGRFLYDPRLLSSYQPSSVSLRLPRVTLEIREEGVGARVVYARIPSTRPNIAYDLVMLGTVEELRDALDVRGT